MPHRFAFEHAFVDPDGGHDGWGAVAVADFDADGRPDIVGKVWRANEVNGNGGRNHVDFLRNAAGQ